MPFIKARLEVPRINFPSYQRALRQEFGDLITLAAVEWVLKAVEIIPVWSGASHATFLHLAREAGFQLSISPEVFSRINLGLRTSDGDIRIDAAAGQFTFEYETSLRHLNINERIHATPDNDPRLQGPLRQPGPYNFRQQARDRAVQILMSGELPNLLQHMKIKKFRRG